MNFEYAILAENAERLRDGRHVLFGADFDLIGVESFPFEFACKFAIKLVLDQGEESVGHKVTMEVVNPDGTRRVLGESDVVFEAVPDRPPELPSCASLVAQLGIRFPEQGVYRFLLSADGVEKKEVLLGVIPAGEGVSE